MSHSISARNKETGLISVTVWDFDGNVFFEEKFDDYHKAIAAATDAERRVTIKAQAGPEMTVDELLAELEGLKPFITGR